MRTFAFSDLHGQGHLWNEINEFLRPDDHVYFLGDAIDRGPNGWALLKELLDDPRMTFIMGNHEDMMVKALQRFPNSCFGRDMNVWGWNGNEETLAAIYKDDPETVLVTLNRVRKLPVEAVYINNNGEEVHLCHAGFTPGARPADDYDFIWDRHHLISAVPEEYVNGNFIVVHGHTPTPLLLNDLDELIRNANWHGMTKLADSYGYQTISGAVHYAEGVKLDIDCGCFATGHIVLVDLDTWEIHPFGEEVDDNDG